MTYVEKVIGFGPTSAQCATVDGIIVSQTTRVMRTVLICFMVVTANGMISNVTISSDLFAKSLVQATYADAKSTKAITKTEVLTSITLASKNTPGVKPTTSVADSGLVVVV